MAAWAQWWFGLSVQRVGFIAATGFVVGAGMELFMIKAWIGQTNCAIAGHPRAQ